MMEEVVEIWKEIPGYNGYQVSNLGRVKGRWGRVMKIQSKGHKDVACIRILNDDNKGCVRVVARLVWLAFNGYPIEEHLCYVYPKNGNKLDCRLENLGMEIREVDESVYDGVHKRRGVKCTKTIIKNMSHPNGCKTQLEEVKTLEEKQKVILVNKMKELIKMLK